MFCFSQFQALLYLQLRILQIIKHKESKGVCPSLFVKCLRVQYLIVEMMLLFRQSVNYFSCKEGYSVLQDSVLIFETEDILDEMKHYIFTDVAKKGSRIQGKQILQHKPNEENKILFHSSEHCIQ